MECALGFAVLLLSVGLAGHASEAGAGAGKALPHVEEAAKGVEGKHLMTVDELYGYGGLGDDAGAKVQYLIKCGIPVIHVEAVR